MSTQNVIVVPVAGDAAQQSGQDTRELASTIQNALEEKAHPEEVQPGPFKQIIANQESLYQYINWNDPVRTLGSYIGALTLLFGAHYLPLTQMVLKGGVTALGLVSVTESASRILGNRSLSAQLRPKEYKTFPEPTLNATLKDIHDFIQYSAVQVQRIVFGQDLQKTFVSFLGLTALYWLVKAVPPFWLAVMALTSIYAAPLLASPRGRQMVRETGAQAQELATSAAQSGHMAVHDATAGAQKLANAATETGRAAVHDARARVDSLTSSTKETGRAATDSITSGAQTLVNQGSELTQKGRNKAANLSEQAKGTASNMSEHARGTASNMTQQAKGTASNMSQQAQGTASNVSESASNSMKSAQQMGSNAASSATSTAKQYTGTQPSSNNDHTYTQSSNNTHNIDNYNNGVSLRGPEGDRTTPRGTATRAAYETTPAYTGVAVTDTSTHQPAVMYTTPGDEAVERSVLERPRGTVHIS